MLSRANKIHQTFFGAYPARDLTTPQSGGEGDSPSPLLSTPPQRLDLTLLIQTFTVTTGKQSGVDCSDVRICVNSKITEAAKLVSELRLLMYIASLHIYRLLYLDYSRSIS